MATARSRTSLSDGWRFAYSLAAPVGPLRSSDDLSAAGLTLFPSDVSASLYMDLFKQGLVDDPRVVTNLSDFAAYEYAHAWYVCQFEGPRLPDGVTAWLAFERIDCHAEVYLNGRHIGSTDNGLIPHRLCADGLVPGENELVVHIRPAMVEAQRYAYPPHLQHCREPWERLYMRRPAHTYGGLGAPRAISPGLGPVALIVEPGDNLGDSFVCTHILDARPRQAELVLYYDLTLADLPASAYELGLEMSCGDSLFADTWPVRFRAGVQWFHIADAQLWLPRGYGEPNLYDCRLTLLRNGQVVDEKHFRHGIRTVQPVASQSTHPTKSHGFRFEVSGREVFVKGALWGQDGPLGLQGPERIERLVDSICDLDCNTIRCWAGDGYASDHLLELCDERGIMVWQDVPLPAEGHAQYPQDAQFCLRVETEVRAVARRAREHPSLVLWLLSGALGEVLDDGYPTRDRLPVDLEDNQPLKTAVIRALHLESPRIPCWETAPDHVPMLDMRLSHQAWVVRDAMPAWSCTDVDALDASEWEDRDDRPLRALRAGCATMFGQSLDAPAAVGLASQIVQAERLKRRIEVARCHPQVHGVIWRRLADPTPMLGSGVLDSDLEPKLAYHYVKRAQMPLLLMGYRDDEHPPGLWSSNLSNNDEHITYWVADVDTDEMLQEGEMDVEPRSCVLLGDIGTVLGGQRCLVIEWRDGAGKLYRNHYLDGAQPMAFDQYRRWMALIYQG